MAVGPPRGRGSTGWESPVGHGQIALAVLACAFWSPPAHAQTPAASDFQKVTLDDNTQNPMELDVANDGRVFYIERDGRLQIWKPNTQQTVTAGTVPVTRSQENGLLGLQLAPDFDTSKLGLPLLLAAARQHADPGRLALQGQRRHARPRLRAEDPDLPAPDRRSAATRPARCTSAPTAASTSPRATTRTRSTPTASTRSTSAPAATYWDAQRTAGNTNDLNGKILRIKPLETVDRHARRRHDVHDPDRQPVPEAEDADNKTRPEIFGMGFRNPFRFTVDPETGWVLGADYGPDASTTNANRGPQGSVEYNVLTKAGNYGWPYCIRDNTPYNDFDFATRTSGPKFDCAAPVNNSPNNTGLTNLPPAIGATAWMGYTETDPRFAGSRHGRRPDGRPALPLRREPRLAAQVPGVLRRQVVHRRVEQRLDQDRRPRRDAAR